MVVAGIVFMATRGDGDPSATPEPTAASGPAAGAEVVSEQPTTAASTEPESATGSTEAPALPIAGGGTPGAVRRDPTALVVVDSPWAPTPCPSEAARVACILGVSLDADTGEMIAPYEVFGFTPELEPSDYHLHFYLDTAIDGDERKAAARSRVAVGSRGTVSLPS